jgi:rSAM/selenodomain-associated transferase 2
MLSIVIPTLNAAGHLPDCLTALAPGRQSGLVGEIIVSDGGSDDRTVKIAEDMGARVVRDAAGRGEQLIRGALSTTGEWMLFLHADTRLAGDWLFAVEAFIDDPDNRRRAAYFRFRLDDSNRKARRLEGIVAWRCRLLALPYGDQGLLVSRLFYGEIGGYRPLPLMEDVDLARRIGKRRLRLLSADAVTSADRYRRDGYWRRSWRNLTCLSLFYLGMPARHIARLYG